MATNAQELYASTVRRLPAQERLRLVALILDELTSTPEASDSWSEQDQRDLTAFALSYSATSHTDEDDELV